MYVEDLRAGQHISLGSFTLSRPELLSFAERWDPQDFHIDETVAATGRFGYVMSGRSPSSSACPCSRSNATGR